MADMSDSGAPILRHGPSGDGFVAATYNSDEREEALSAHRERYLGPSATVFHEIVSTTVHVDLWPHAARRGKGLTVVTQGASALATPTPEGISPWFEVMTYVPESFLTKEYTVVSDESSWWPGRMLKTLARFPHEVSTWIGIGHSLSFTEPPSPLVEGSLLTSVLLMPPPEDEGFAEADVPGGSVRYLFAMPITLPELQLKMSRGTDALLDALDAADVSFVCDAGRACAVSSTKKRRFFGRG